MRLIHPSALLRAKVILFLRYDGFLAGRPPNTFLKGMEKVLEGLVKKQGWIAISQSVSHLGSMYPVHSLRH